MTDATPKVIELEGRKFTVLTRPPLKQFLWISREIRAAGFYQFEVDADDTPEQMTEKLLEIALSSDKLLTIVGGMMLPEGATAKEWTPAVAAGVTKHLEQLTELEDHEKMKPIISGVLISFFKTKAASIVISRKSSPAVSPEPAASGHGSSTGEPTPTSTIGD